MGQEYPPEKDTKRSSPAPLRRRLHEFYFGGALCLSFFEPQTEPPPDVSFRTPPRGATACRENVFLLLANTLASVSQLCRTRIIEGGKIIPRKSLQPNNWQKILSPRSFGMPLSNAEWAQKSSLSRVPTRKREPKGAPYANGRSKGQRAMCVEKGTSPI